MSTPEINKGTSEALRILIDDVLTNVEALKVLNVPVDLCDFLINAIILSKLDYNSRREFENT